MSNDDHKQALQLLANFSNERASFVRERTDAACKLVEELCSLGQYGWHFKKATHQVSVEARCDHVGNGTAVVEITYHPDKNTWQITPVGSRVADSSSETFKYNLAEDKFNGVGDRSALVVLVEHVVQKMGEPKPRK